MQLYSEIYNAYYDIVHKLLSHTEPFSQKDLENTVAKDGFLETTLSLVPKLADGEWEFFERQGESYISTLDAPPVLVLSLLQKRWLKAILADIRIRLFFSEDQLSVLEQKLEDVEPLFQTEDFYFYDRFLNGDDYADENYRNNFRVILDAIKSGQYLNIGFESHRQKRMHFWYLPCKLEYSVKNDCFRLLALEARGHGQNVFYTINLSRITSLTETGKFAETRPDIDEYITKGYETEPVTLIIKNERNALERAMLQFASYKKNTTRLDENTYQCEIYYNKSNETELLIEVLSFGPMIKVIGNEHFLKLLKERLLRQMDFFQKDNFIP